MKVVLNKEYGGYEVPEVICNRLGCDKYNDTILMRTNAVFIHWVLDNFATSTLRVCDVPEEATDFRIIDYDGYECLLYVMNGKMYDAYVVWD